MEHDDVFLVLGGRAPNFEWLAAAAKARNIGEIWAADKGGSYCLSARIFPRRLIGDLDSIPKADAERLAAHGTKIEQYPKDKDMTDYQLCLQLAAREGKKNVVVTGCWGGRFDHVLSNVCSALWAREWGVRVQCLADEREALFYLYDQEAREFLVDKNVEAISILALEKCTGVSVSGTKWELHDAEILPSKPFAISNRLDDGADKIKVSLKSGSLGVYFSATIFAKGDA